jgi:hypothetical protein
MGARTTAFLSWLLLVAYGPLSAQPLWQPAGIRPTSDTAEAVVAKMHASNASAGMPADARVDRFLIDSGGTSIVAQARIRGDAYAITASLADHRIVVGRAHGERWRKNAAGTLHLIRADVQGDDFDRWPVAEVGFSLSDCTLAGEATVEGRPVWVLADRPALDIPRFLYVDRATGDIVREISREGTRVEQYDFTDVRGEPPARRAFSWSVSGIGAMERVTLESSQATDVSERDVAIAMQGPPAFSEPVAPRKLSATFANPNRAIMVDVGVAGRRRTFQLDSGTPEMIVDPSITKPLEPIVLNHLTIPTLDVDGSVGTDVAAIQTPGFTDGLLGYDFFRGKIVHVDYARERVDILPRTGFVPPADAEPLLTDWREGMPLVTASIGGFASDRFQLDLGSKELVIGRAFLERSGLAKRLDTSMRVHSMHYLEGRVSVSGLHVPSFTLGSVTLTGLLAAAEDPDPENLTIPLDAVVGSDVLANFEWWFDADGAVTWYRAAPR